MNLVVHETVHSSYSNLLAVCIVFSAVEVQKSKSSIVAIKVGSLSLQHIFDKTCLPVQIVLTVKSFGVLKLSGEIASAIALAIFAVS